MLSIGTGACTTTDAELILRGRACGAYGACATGFVCDDRVNLCVLPSQLAGVAGGGAGGTAARASDAGPTGDAAADSSAEAGVDMTAEQSDPATGALAARLVSCGEAGHCGGQDKCCASPSTTSCRPATSWCGCSTCVALMCDELSDCPEGTVCCANAEPGTRCLPPSECAGALGCTEADGCLGPHVCTIEAVVDGRCRGLVELLQ